MCVCVSELSQIYHLGLEMASKRVKIVISKIDKKDKMKEYSLETPSTNDDISASRNARKFKKKTN